MFGIDTEDKLWRNKMAKRRQKTQKAQTKEQELVTVAFAEDLEQAKDYETLLKNNEIPALTKKSKEETTDNTTIVVMVPKEFIDEARVIIESHDCYDEFYDFDSDDIYDDDFEDFLDNDF